MSVVDAECSVASTAETRPYGEVQKGYTCFSNGDVLLAKITPCFENGKIAEARVRSEFAFGSTEFHVLRPRTKELDTRYLIHFLRRDKILIEGERKMTGSGGQRRVPKHFLESLQIPLPDLAEQRRIAAILDKADALRAKRREALAVASGFARSIFNKMFGDPRQNPKKLPKVALRTLMELKSGNFLPASAMNNEGRYSVFGGNGVSGTHDEYMFDAPKIVIGRVGVYCGCVHVSPRESWITDNALYVSKIDDRVEFDFLAFSLAQANLNQYASQSAQPLVSGSRIYPVEILLPSKTEQLEFASRAKVVARIQHKLASSAAELDGMFHSLQHRAFTGAL